MNEEEKKIKNNSIKKSPQPNIKKNILNIKDGAAFETFLPNVTDILQRLEKNLPQYKLNGYKNIWIMKPSNLSRGRGVTCVDSLQPIEQSLTATNDSGLIVQKYIENPLIIKKRKFDIRQWVLVTSLNPLVIWMWKEPYLRFGAEDYIMDDLNNIYSHLTNNSIAKHSEQFKNEKNFEGDMWTCQDFASFIGENEWKDIHEKIKNAIICSFYAVHHEIKQRGNSHELFGYDFMIDEDKNVYLIEVNASPALDYSTKITKEAVQKMVKDLITLIIDYNNARDFKVDKNGEGHPNKFIQIFNETRDRIKIPENVPNKNLFY
jgi:tubulin monoglycylase TTLL3/8